MRSIDGNACQASEGEANNCSPAAKTTSSASMQGKAHQPASKRIARPRGAGHMDFGVQVYAKPPPPARERTQVCPCWKTGLCITQAPDRCRVKPSLPVVSQALHSMMQCLLNGFM